jgi:hypothetical protein
MQTSTKWILGGLAGAGVLYLLWPKTASAATQGKIPSTAVPALPTALMPLASQPGALIVQPDPNSVSLVQTAVPPIWGLQITAVGTIDGQVFLTNKVTIPLTTSDGISDFPVSGPVPDNQTMLQNLLPAYMTALPTNIKLSNPPYNANAAPQGGFWRASYDMTISNSDRAGKVTTRNTSHDFDLQGYPSGGPAPSDSVVKDAVYHDMLGAM